MRNREVIAKAARAAAAQSMPPSQGEIDSLLRKVAKGYPEFDQDQSRDASGKWTAGGGGGSSAGKPGQETGGEAWRRRAINAALLGAGLAAGGPLVGAGLRAAARRLYAQRLANRRAANAAYRAARRESAHRAARDAAAAQEARNLLSRGIRRTGAAGRRATRAAQRGAEAADARATRAARAAAAATVGKLPPKAQQRLREATRHGQPTFGDPAGKLIDLPTWLWPF